VREHRKGDTGTIGIAEFAARIAVEGSAPGA
jgi:hypothetical protein